MNAWATTIISALVLVVAFMQWRTAHQKVLLDLFEKRLAVFEKLKKAVDHMASAGMPYDQVGQMLTEAFEASVFLFGTDVQKLIDRIWTINLEIKELTIRKYSRNPLPGDDARHTELALEVSKTMLTAAWIFGPYMRMDQKLIRTPAEWIADRNRIRLSYGDEKQK